MRYLAALASAIALLPCAHSILLDDAFQIDYHIALLGKPQSHSTFFLRPQTSSSASLLYTVSDKNVLGAINPKDGSVVWRQALQDLNDAEFLASYLKAAEGDGSVISAVGDTVASWDALHGQLTWKHVASADQQALSLTTVPSVAGTVSSDPVVLFGKNPATIRRLEAGSGKAKWEFVDTSGDTPIALASTPTAVYYLSRHSALLGAGKLKVTILDPNDGHEKKQHTLNGDGDISSENAKLGLVGHGSMPFVYLAEKPFKTLKINPAGSTKFISLNIENNSGENIQDVIVHGPSSANALPHFLVHYRTATKSWAEVYHIDVKSLSVTKAYSLPILEGPDAIASSAIDANTYFTRTTSSEVILYSSASHGVLGRWPRSGESDISPLHAASETVSRGAGSFAIRVAQISSSGELSLIRNGETSWTRPELLASITAAAWADIGGDEGLVHELEVEGHENIVAAYLHRVKRHIAGLSSLPQVLSQLPQNILSAFEPSSDDDTKAFFKGKVLIAATNDGKVLSLDPLNQGKILWSFQAPEKSTKWEVRGITVSQGRATVFLDRAGSITFDIRTGELLKSNRSGFETKGIAQFTGISGDIIIRTTHSGSPYNFDGTDGQPLEGSFLVSLSDEGELSGWSVASLSTPLWKFVPAPGFKITGAIARPAHDPVASIGKVLGDRSVLYKYLNPNLALVTSVSSNALTVYLLESVTGAILFTSTHEGVDIKLPIPAVISENWLAYSFYGNVGDSSTKSYQLVIHELYESSIPNDRGPLGSTTNQSAFDLGSIVQPHVISQSFSIPEQISSMAVTQTTQGITTRQLICTLPETNSIIGIPRQFLDPRRPVDRDPTPVEVEEGLFRYSPVIDFDPKWLLTHSRDVVGIKKVITTPTDLESTSLVFTFGHDIFGTRLSPSMPFDILGKGFNKVQLLLTVVALFVGVQLLAPMVRKRQVDARWKL